MPTKHEQLAIDVKPGKYIVAVSGGVDSVVLLDLLASQPGLDLVVAHFDHGIRPDSAADREFVERLAQGYGRPFEYAQGKLGAEASEETARQARYEFLGSIKKRHKADAILTAHHQDDVIETAIINLIRGTHRKGLSSLKSTARVIRPLLDYSRPDIEGYAKRRGLEWRDDPSNADTRYLRNYVRLAIVPQLAGQDPAWRQRFLNKISRSAQINQEIDGAIDHLAEKKLEIEEGRITIPRGWLIMLPNSVGQEVLAYAIERLGRPVVLSRQLIKSGLLFSKTARPGKHRPLSAEVELWVKPAEVVLKTAADADKTG